jgi:hypothetical protein
MVFFEEFELTKDVSMVGNENLGNPTEIEVNKKVLDHHYTERKSPEVSTEVTQINSKFSFILLSFQAFIIFFLYPFGGRVFLTMFRHKIGKNYFQEDVVSG